MPKKDITTGTRKRSAGGSKTYTKPLGAKSDPKSAFAGKKK